MRILIVSGSYYPDKTPRSFRTTELARELVRQGHKVDVFIPSNNIDIRNEKKMFGVNINFLKKHNWKTFPTKGKLGEFSRKLNRILELFFEYPGIETKKLILQSLKNAEQYDLLVSIAYPHVNHWGCSKLLKHNPQLCKCWIADCGDPYMGSTLLNYKHPFYFKYIEKNWCRKADYITVPIEGAKEGYYEEFRHKIRVIPQGFRMDDIKLAEYVKNPIPTFAYSGGVGYGPRNPLPFIDFILSKQIECRFVIYTNQFDFFKAYREFKQVELHNYVPRAQLLKELSTMDFLINMDNGTERQLPSKLIDYAITDRPILNIKANQLDYDTIMAFMSGNYTKRMKVMPKEEYDITVIAKRFIELASHKHCQ